MSNFEIPTLDKKVDILEQKIDEAKTSLPTIFLTEWDTEELFNKNDQITIPSGEVNDIFAEINLEENPAKDMLLRWVVLEIDGTTYPCELINNGMFKSPITKKMDFKLHFKLEFKYYVTQVEEFMNLLKKGGK